MGSSEAFAVESEGQLEPPGAIGFRSFALAESNFRVWDGGVEDDLDLKATLTLFAEGTSESSTTGGIVAELLLKAGFQLIEPVDVIEVAGVALHSVAGGELLIAVEGKLTLESVEQMVAMKPALVLVLDRCFGDDDELKVNVMQTIRSANQGGGADITLKVV